MKMDSPLLNKSEWSIPLYSPQIDLLIRELNLHRIVATLLVQRGMDTPEKADRFLNPCLTQLHDPKKLPDYSIALKEILGAKERNELIFVHGDYDVDGISSTALLTRFLRSIGCNVLPHVPHRIKEGYGIHEKAIHKAAQAGAKLILTCDCGIKAHDQILTAREYGIRVVVTDHHEVGEELPEAHAVINPHRKDSEYPFKQLCGAGVVFKLCEGITQELGFKVENYYRAFLDLATLGTIADMVPLIDENRVIVKFGLEKIQQTKKVGLKTLLEISECPQLQDNLSLKSWHIGYRLGPRLNAAGRIDSATLALDLLLESEPIQALEIAQKLEIINQQRRLEQQEAVDKAIQKIHLEGLESKPLIFLTDTEWHPGLIGLVAGKIAEKFCRPCFVSAIDPITNIVKGSARTIEGIHLSNLIEQYKHLFISCGGHEKAAGFSFQLDNLLLIQNSLENYIIDNYKSEIFTPQISADLLVDPSEINKDILLFLEALEPFGESHPEPKFASYGLKVVQVQHTQNPQHCRLTLKSKEDEFIQAMAFGIGEQFSPSDIGKTIDVLFQPKLDVYRGVENLKWYIKNFQFS